MRRQVVALQDRFGFGLEIAEVTAKLLKVEDRVRALALLVLLRVLLEFGGVLGAFALSSDQALRLSDGVLVQGLLASAQTDAHQEVADARTVVVVDHQHRVVDCRFFWLSWLFVRVILFVVLLVFLLVVLVFTLVLIALRSVDRLVFVFRLVTFQLVGRLLFALHFRLFARRFAGGLIVSGRKDVRFLQQDRRDLRDTVENGIVAVHFDVVPGFLVDRYGLAANHPAVEALRKAAALLDVVTVRFVRRLFSFTGRWTGGCLVLLCALFGRVVFGLLRSTWAIGGGLLVVGTAHTKLIAVRLADWLHLITGRSLDARRAGLFGRSSAVPRSFLT